MPNRLRKDLAEKIARSQIFKDYERAFSETTRMPLSFHPVESWKLAQSGKKYENPFCALLAEASPSCAMCLENQHKISDPNATEPKTAICLAGLYDSAVPVRLGNEVLGFLQTGQVLMRKPTKAQFSKVAKQIISWGINTDLKKLEEAYFHTTVVSNQQYQAMLRLLQVFALHLSMTAEQIAVQQENAESPMITRAKKYIEERKDEKISLRDVAKVVNASTFYFCKMFKKSTGLTFTEYLSLVRTTKAKNLLLNPNLRISEIAFQVGFESLTHFNRVFRKLVGRSPSQYRDSLPKLG